MEYRLSRFPIPVPLTQCVFRRSTPAATATATPTPTPTPTPATVTTLAPVIQQTLVLGCETAALQQGLVYYELEIGQGSCSGRGPAGGGVDRDAIRPGPARDVDGLGWHAGPFTRTRNTR